MKTLVNIKRLKILSAIGDKDFYRRAINSHCDAGIYLLFKNESKIIHLFRNDQDHDHSERKKIQGIDPNVQTKIKYICNQEEQ